jgi:hypothetical protein
MSCDKSLILLGHVSYGDARSSQNPYLLSVFLTARSSPMIKKILLLPALLLLSSLTASAADKLSDIRSKIEGTYELIEWDDAGVKLTPPQVAARYIIRDGKVTWISHKNANGKLMSNALYGGYGEWLEVVVEDGQTRVSREPKPDMKSLTLPTMRTLALTLENGVVHAVGTTTRFEFRDEGMTQINTNSGYARKYKRVKH